jgi:hydroxymethylpyrimidine pyrophosphatase-like HAD family hydrolase
VLPLGANTGAGVSQLLDRLATELAGLLAPGAGGNDIEMQPCSQLLYDDSHNLLVACWYAGLQVLPLGASKGAGVSWLLNHLGMDSAGLLALGDGENDIKMLQLAAVGVAMGNAGAKVKAAADVVVGSNDEDGVAQAIHEYVLKPRGLSQGAAAVAVPATAAAAGGGGSR